VGIPYERVEATNRGQERDSCSTLTKSLPPEAGGRARAEEEEDNADDDEGNLCGACDS
jgi:hypothetical protein